MSDNYILMIAGVIVGVLGYLLSKKDDAQEQQLAAIKEICEKDNAATAKQITALWEKHDADARALNNLEHIVGSRHYERSELDTKFDKLETAIQLGLTNLGTKVDKLTEAVIHRGGIQ